MVLTAIEPSIASAPRELCYCLVRVIGVCTCLLLASDKSQLFNLCRLGTVLPFSVPRERLPFSKTWLVLPAGRGINDKKSAATVGFI